MLWGVLWENRIESATGTFNTQQGTIDSTSGAFTWTGIEILDGSCGTELQGTVSPDGLTLTGTAVADLDLRGLGDHHDRAGGVDGNLTHRDHSSIDAELRHSCT